MNPSRPRPADFSPLYPFLLLSPFCFGLFYEFTSYLAGAVLCVILLVIWRSNRKFCFPVTPVTVGFSWLIAWYGLTVFWATDHGMAFAGFLKYLTAGLFLFVFLQLEPQQRKKCLDAVPLSGALMTLLSLAAGLSPSLRTFFFQAGRLGGFFQYANTFALYLLAGLIILAYRPHFHGREWGAAGLLLLGILLTGSRTVFILLALTAVYFLLTARRLRKTLMIAIPCVLLLGICVASLSGNYQTFGRFLTISLHSSTLLGRLLYARDALLLLAKEPFGLGYLGYFFRYPEVQSGVYTVRFVHNEFLQTALDAGIPALIGLVSALCYAIFSPKTGRLQRQLLLTIGLHALLDFDFAFSSVLFLVMMAAAGQSNAPHGKIIRMIPSKCKRILIGSLAIVLLYFSASFWADYSGYDALAIRMYPGNTLAKTELLRQLPTPEETDRLASQLIKQNPHIALAYEAKSAVARFQKEYETAILYKQQAVLLQPYRTEAYDEWAMLLLDAADNSWRNGRQQQAVSFVKAAQAVVELLAAMKDRASPLAYEIRDTPAFTLTEKTSRRLSAAQQAYGVDASGSS